MAKQLAETEYDKFHSQRLSQSANTLSDFDKVVDQLEAPNHQKKE